MDFRDQSVVLSVEGESEMDCLRKIQEANGLNYMVTSLKKTKIPCSKIFKFIKKDGVKIEYVLTRFPYATSLHSYKTSESPLYQTPQTVPQVKSQNENDFETEKRKIVENSGFKSNVQISEMYDAVLAMRDTIEKSNVLAEKEHPSIEKIENMLENNEFSPSYIKKVTEFLRKNFSIDDLDNFDEVEESVLRFIGKSIKIDALKFDAAPHIIILVGPTGVGKTTTVAKLAAKFKFGDKNDQNRNVRIITTDYYRIGAVEQIKVYGDTMGIPTSFVDTNDDLVQILKTNAKTDEYVIIDTAGYSPKDYESIAKMKAVLDLHNYSVETYLCVMATTKLSDMKDIMQQYEIFGYKSVIITKFDETNRVGNIICACNDKNKEFAFLTTGQGVPKCIEKSSVVRILMELADFRINRERLEGEFGKINPLSK